MNPPETQDPIRQDYDGAWKAALEKYFKEFLELLFPAIHAAVDWTKGHQFLDGELEKITVDAKTGRRYTDKLVKVYYQDGSEEWLLIHVEIQSLPEAYENRFFEDIKLVEEELKMPYINVIEQYGIRQGIKQGLEQGRLEAKQRFEEGRREAAKQAARGMFSVEGLNDERIAEITGLALEDVAQLRLGHQH